MSSRLAVRRLNRAEECTLDARSAIERDEPREAARHVRDAMASLQYAFHLIADESEVASVRPHFQAARVAIDRCNSTDTLDMWLGRETELGHHLRAAALDQEPLDSDGVQDLLQPSHKEEP